MSLPIPMLDLTTQFRSIEDEVHGAVHRVLASQHFILGPEVQAFEREVADFLGCAHAVGVSSGTDALLAALMALGIGPGDEVVTTPFTFFATAGAIHRLGARPVFVDVDPATLCIDPGAAAAAVGPHTRAVIPVHLFGYSANMDPLLDLSRERGVAIVEDAAQSIGADFDRRMTGTLGAYGCFSFFPSKNLGGIGDGGLVTTDDDDRAELLFRLRAHGSKPKYFHHMVGGNFRLDAINAAVLRVKLRHLGEWNRGRRRNATRYRELMKDASLVGADGPVFSLPPPDGHGRHVFHQYVVRVADRDALRDALASQGIATAVYYPIPLHLQPCFADLGYDEGDLPVAEQATREVLALPMFPELTDQQQRRVVDAIAAFFRS